MSNVASTNEQENKIVMKGTRDGLLIIFPDGMFWNDLLKQLGEILDKDKSFWIGASTSIDLGSHKLDEIQINRLNEMLIKRYHLLLESVYCKEEITRSSAEKIGLKVGKIHPGSPRAAATVEHLGDVVQNSNVSMGNAIYLKQTIRSGQTVKFDGNIVIYGDTNPGSQIIASGDIIVIGSLRGIAHAGAKGDEKSQIMATNLRPTQLRIASYIGLADDHKQNSDSPEYACVTDGKIYIGNVKNKK